MQQLSSATTATAGASISATATTTLPNHYDPPLPPVPPPLPPAKATEGEPLNASIPSVFFHA